MDGGLQRAADVQSAVQTPGATGQATEWLAGLDRALAGSDIAAALALFGDECYWRDLVAFTWNVKTLEGRDEIAAMLRGVLLSVCPAGWRLDAEFMGLAVFGQAATMETPLHDDDRIELLRALQIDPKQARRLRAARAKGAP